MPRMSKVELFAAIRRDSRAGMSGPAIATKYRVSRRIKSPASLQPAPFLADKITADTTTTTSLLVPDTSSEQRWPGWAQEAAQAGVHSSLSVGLPVHATTRKPSTTTRSRSLEPSRGSSPSAWPMPTCTQPKPSWSTAVRGHPHGTPGRCFAGSG
jgi:hypothetical protein